MMVSEEIRKIHQDFEKFEADMRGGISERSFSHVLFQGKKTRRKHVEMRHNNRYVNLIFRQIKRATSAIAYFEYSMRMRESHLAQKKSKKYVRDIQF